MYYLSKYCSRLITNDFILYQILFAFVYSKDDRLPNSDATQQAVDTKDNEKSVAPARETKHFPSNIDKTGYVIFSVSCKL